MRHTVNRWQDQQEPLQQRKPFIKESPISEFPWGGGQNRQKTGLEVGGEVGGSVEIADFFSSHGHTPLKCSVRFV